MTSGDPSHSHQLRNDRCSGYAAQKIAVGHGAANDAHVWTFCERADGMWVGGLLDEFPRSR